ncbi:hypothetical protein [Candidatus Nitrosotalea bavarica]|jgi:hypothetical protein|uniref:hypothetical protein n=1 Tax=Candidatus Nitrosotalea bavarica TaxID=1903277 RepID=UPI000C6FF366|nr:hypothetical protein [Candidatus Nitrosotalea bavarica]
MNKTKKALVSVAIESTLLKKGGIPLLDEVNYGLYKKFNSSIAECHEHPEYLKGILQEIFGVDHQEITNSIVKELTAFNYDDKVMQFIEMVS